MTNTNISFSKEKNGYDKSQVDSYIKKLSDAYQKTFDEYKDVSDKYKNLLEDYNKSNTQERKEMNSDIIAKTLINAEILAQKVLDDAHAEASDVIAEANRVVESANAEAAKAQETANEIINEANTEAVLMVAQARKSIEQARKTMEQATRDAEKLLTFQIVETENVVAA